MSNPVKELLDNIEDSISHNDYNTIEIITNTVKLTVTIFDLSYDDACAFLQKTFKCTAEISQAVLRKPISYLTKEHQQEITDLQNTISELENDQSDIFEMLTKKYRALKTKMLKVIAPNTTKFI